MSKSKGKSRNNKAVTEQTVDHNETPVATPVAQEAAQATEAVPVAESNTAKRAVEKDRPKQNGVTRPSAGGMCRAVWDFCDDFTARNEGTLPTSKQVKEHATSVGWNSNNASIEYYQWRKFHGVRGRVAKPVETQAAA